LIVRELVHIPQDMDFSNNAIELQSNADTFLPQ
jgi:hypothetical protein